MGEVYRARDPRLRREVAVKILPAEIAGDPDRLARFTREAQAASALKHPNIVSIYDVGLDGEAHYIVMELIEGRSLREMIVRGGMPIRQVLQIAAQAAEGLANAHAAGIVHRDLKPENVMVTAEGLVKILDFGLAKQHPTRAAAESATASRLDSFATSPGLTFGTPAYMSPEQATSADVDYRSDQFALGALMYELASGQSAFRGPSAVETLSAIIRAEPPSLASVRADLPAPLIWIIERCLQKDPRQRYDSTGDLARDLVNLRDRGTSFSMTVPASATRSERVLVTQLRWAWGLAAMLVLVLAGLVVSRLASRNSFGEAASQQPPLQMGIAGPGPTGTAMPFNQGNTTLALSPDGLSLVLVGGGRLFLRSMDSLTLNPLPDTEGAGSPEWSPDGRFVAFVAQSKLKKIDVRAGTVQVLADANMNGGISWAPGGTILFPGSTDRGNSVLKTTPEGGGVTTVVAPDPAAREVAHLWPQMLPDGRHFLYLTLRADDTTGSMAATLRTASIDGGDGADLGPIASRALFDRAGYLLYSRGGALVVHPFDPAARRFIGEPAVLADRFYYFRSTGLADFALSTTGTVVFRTPPPASRLVWLDRAGTEVGRLGDEARYGEPRISRDGARVALDITDPALGTGDLWIFDRALGTSVRVTHSPADEHTPMWSPDGTTLFYSSDATGPPDLYRRELANGREELLLSTKAIETPTDVSPDARDLLFTRPSAATSFDVWKLRLDGTADVDAVLQSPAGESSARYSPDGRWVAYDSNESGRYEAYIQSLDNPGMRWKVSQGGGVNPEWGPEGKELFFVGSESRLMSVPISQAPSFRPGTPRPLFQMNSNSYSVLPDASRFLVVEPGRAASPPITAIVNWRRLIERSRE
jgi:Tol biopolymer transport system component